MTHDTCSINRRYSYHYPCCTTVEGAFISLVDGKLSDQRGETVSYTYKTSQTHTLSNDPLESGETCIFFFNYPKDQKIWIPPEDYMLIAPIKP